LSDGTEIVCSLAKEPQMLFGEKSITLTSLVGEVGQWDFVNVESWKFSDRLDQDEIDAIDRVKAEKPRIMIEDGRIIIQNSKLKLQNSKLKEQDLQAAVYDTSGRLMFQVSGSKFNVNRLAKGTYLLKVGDSCIKFSVGR
jgi:hypothetical protein